MRSQRVVGVFGVVLLVGALLSACGKKDDDDSGGPADAGDIGDAGDVEDTGATDTGTGDVTADTPDASDASDSSDSADGSDVPDADDVCGDGLVGESEECDDGNVDVESCEYGEQSCMVCGSDCALTSGTVTGYCGDGELNGPETCDDGDAITNDCAPGETSCTVCGEECTETDGVIIWCGDGVANGTEHCDGDDVPLSCEAHGFAGGGVMGCSMQCRYDMSACSEGYVDLAVGSNHTCGLLADGRVECWGRIGGGTVPSEPFESIQGYGNGTCGMTSDGYIECWETSMTVGLPVRTEEAWDEYRLEGTLCAWNADAGGAHCWDSDQPPQEHDYQELVRVAGVTTDGELILFGRQFEYDGSPDLAPSTLQGNPDVEVLNVWYSRELAIEYMLNGAEHRLRVCSSDQCTDRQLSSSLPLQDVALGATPLCVAFGDGTTDCLVDLQDPPMEVAFRGAESCGLYADGRFECTCRGPYLAGEGRDGVYDRISMFEDSGCVWDTRGGYRCWDSDFGPPCGGDSTTDPLEEIYDLPYAGFCHIDSDHELTCANGQTYSGAESVAARPESGFICVLDTDGYVHCGVGLPGGPTDPVPGTVFASISLGDSHGCGLDIDGFAHCWGENSDGRATPPPLAFSEIHAVSSFSCGLDLEGTLHCWGSTESANWQSSELPDDPLATIEMTHDRACAIVADGGAVACTSQNLNGEGSPPPGEFVALGLGDITTCGLRPNGQLECWGEIIRPTAYDSSVCGDGFAAVNEQCDDGNTELERCPDGPCLTCGPTCHLDGGSACGDGIVDDGEECDDGNARTDHCDEAGCTVCRADCTFGPGLDPTCGNGVVEPEHFETCEGNTTIACDALGYTDGMATCVPDTCGWDVSGCSSEYIDLAVGGYRSVHALDARGRIITPGETGLRIAEWEGPYVDIEAAGQTVCATNSAGNLDCWSNNDQAVPPSGLTVGAMYPGAAGGCALVNDRPVCWGAWATWEADLPAVAYLDLHLQNAWACGIGTAGDLLCAGSYPPVIDDPVVGPDGPRFDGVTFAEIGPDPLSPNGLCVRGGAGGVDDNVWCFEGDSVDALGPQPALPMAGALSGPFTPSERCFQDTDAVRCDSGAEYLGSGQIEGGAGFAESCILRPDGSIDCGFGYSRSPYIRFDGWQLVDLFETNDGVLAIHQDGAIESWFEKTRLASDWTDVQGTGSYLCGLDVDRVIRCVGDIDPPPAVPVLDYDIGSWGICALYSTGQLYCHASGPRGALRSRIVAEADLPTDTFAVEQTSGPCVLSPSQLLCITFDDIVAHDNPDGDWIDMTAGANVICAASADGDVDCLLTDPSASLPDTLPEVPVSSIVGASFDRYCGLDSDGEVHCWGDPMYLSASEPAPAGPFVSIRGGNNFCAVRPGGGAVCWGEIGDVVGQWLPSGP